jgi:hypothetical protein
MTAACEADREIAAAAKAAETMRASIAQYTEMELQESLSISQHHSLASKNEFDEQEITS